MQQSAWNEYGKVTLSSTAGGPQYGTRVAAIRQRIEQQSDRVNGYLAAAECTLPARPDATAAAPDPKLPRLGASAYGLSSP